MIAFNINTLEKAQQLVAICDRYKKYFSIDIMYGRYIVDGSSILGVSSLIGKIVSVVAPAENEKYKEFSDEIKNASGCY